MTTIERAARAMCTVSGRHGFPILNADPDFGDYPLTEEGTDDMNPFTEDDVVALVRAVLQAICEPVEGEDRVVAIQRRLLIDGILAEGA
jgi:hypothetical protein